MYTPFPYTHVRPLYGHVYVFTPTYIHTYFIHKYTLYTHIHIYVYMYIYIIYLNCNDTQSQHSIERL